MKNRIAKLIDDFHEREIPALVPRNTTFNEIPGKADVVIGMRRSGKTWFCYQKITELLESGEEREKILYLNFDDDRLLEFNVDNFQEILDVYFGKYPEHRQSRCYFFFDEIQRIDQWELFIRRLLDTENIQVVITGPSSKLLSSEIATSLRGRSLTTEIFPLSFEEYITFHEYLPGKPKTFGANTVSLLRKAVKEYLETGGFPEVQKLDQALRIEILQGYIDSVLLKDIIERYGVANVQALKYLVRHVMLATGGKFSVNKFYNTLRSTGIKCTKNSLYEYIDHLEESFLFYRVPIHSRSEKSRLLNPSKIYTIDTGILNSMTFRNSASHGPLLENLVFMHLRREGFETEYIVTQGGFEVDFHARHRISREARLIQVCWDMEDDKTLNRELRGLKTAMEYYSLPGTIVTWDDEVTIDDSIRVVPVLKWLLT